MKGKEGDSSVKDYIGMTPDPTKGGEPPRKSVGPKRVKGESYMAAKGESAATSLKAARTPTYWRRGGFVQGYAKGGFHPGGEKGKLHRELGISTDKKIPADRLQSAAHSSNPEVRRDAIRAQTMKKWHHGK